MDPLVGADISSNMGDLVCCRGARATWEMLAGATARGIFCLDFVFPSSLFFILKSLALSACATLVTGTFACLMLRLFCAPGVVGVRVVFC